MAKSQTQDATNKSNSLYQNVEGVISGTGPSGVGGGGQVGRITGLQGSANQFATDTGSAASTGYKNIASTGGYDPTQLQAITGGYQAFADTGGFTPQQSTDYINAATSGVGGTYDVLAGQQQRQRAAQGLGAGGGEFEAMAREGTAAQEQADLNARSNLAQQVNANKLAGLGGLQTTQQNVAGNELAANAGLSNLYNTATGEVTAQGQQILQALGLQFGSQGEAINFLTSLSKNPGLFGNIMQGLGAVSGAGMSTASGGGFTL